MRRVQGLIVRDFALSCLDPSKMRIYLWINW